MPWTLTPPTSYQSSSRWFSSGGLTLSARPFEAMPRIFACYVVYNEAQLIAESLRSVKAYVDGFVVIDVAFPHNPSPGTHSSDDTRAICEAVCPPVPLTYVESNVRINQWDARNRYLELVPDGDYVFIVDGDEVLHGDYREIQPWIRSLRAAGQLDASLKVFTTAVSVRLSDAEIDQLAGRLPPEMYATAPVVNTAGFMTRFVKNDRSRGLHYRLNAQGVWGSGLYDRTEECISRAEDESAPMFLVNHHARQSYASWVVDLDRERAERGGGPPSRTVRGHMIRLPRG